MTQREAIDWFCGCAKDDPGSVDEFLAQCHSDKLRELAIEKRQKKEAEYYAQQGHLTKFTKVFVY